MKKRLILFIILSIISICYAARTYTKELKNTPLYENTLARGHDKRIDLHWPLNWKSSMPGFQGYNIYKAPTPNGPFIKLNKEPWLMNIYCDWIGTNNITCYYKIKIQVHSNDNEAGLTNAIFSAQTRSMNQEELLNSIQEATFRCFYDGLHPASGLTRDSLYNHDWRWDFCTLGGTGMGLMALVIGVERKYISRDQAVNMTLKILSFIQNKCEEYHGAFAHWVNGQTGDNYDENNNADVVETAYLAQGLLTIHQYFDQKSPQEEQIRTQSRKLWENIEWDWYLRSDDQEKDRYSLVWSWSPEKGWGNYFGGFDETMIAYLLGIASPTHPIPVECYKKGWVKPGDSDFYDGTVHYGYKQYVTRFRSKGNIGMPLFWLHYSFLGFDPHGKKDGIMNQEDDIDLAGVFRNITLIDRAYCASDNPEAYKGYNWDTWGFTACIDPTGYWGHKPGQAEEKDDNGTLAPTAAISSIVYTPQESLSYIRNVYDNYGDKLFGEFGFRDAFTFNKTDDKPYWYAKEYLAIDQAPILIMIENHRTQLIWKLFMSHPDIQNLLKLLKKSGWKIEERLYK